jgi:AbrB family looped-hinge helix DNA binding protein
MRVTSKGQVTTPVDIRERAGLLPNTEVVFEYDGTVVSLRKAKPRKGQERGANCLRIFGGRRNEQTSR